MTAAEDRPDPVDLTKHRTEGGLVPPAQLRASTADRERISQVLQRAMAEGRITVDELSERLEQVYAARTLGELEPITRDLPEHQPLVPVTLPAPGLPQPHAPYPLAPQHAAGPVVPAATPTSSIAIAVLGGAVRKGAWVVPASFSAVAVMGGVELDLTEAVFTSTEVTVTAFSLMGGIEIKVPDDVVVKEDGIGIMGGFDSSVPPAHPQARAYIRVRGVALMGGVEVRRLSDKERRKRLKEQKRLRGN